jgi:hypothetical protein
MARRSLKPQLNQIRAWVRQGRTDAWIAHQLEISTSELREFRKQHDLSADAEEGGAEVDLRDEIEAEIEAAAEEDARRAAEEAEKAEAEGGEAEEVAEATVEAGGSEAETEEAEARDEGEGEGPEPGGEARPRRRRRRGRRGGRGRRKELEATFDHGEADGYGLWLDPAIKDNPVYAEHWAGKREVTVRIEADQIVIRRAGSPEPSGPADDED